MAKFKVRLQDQEVELDVTRQGDHLRVTYDGQTAELTLLHADEAAFTLEHERPDGRRQQIRAVAHVEGDERQLWVNGRSFTYERVRQRAAGAASDAGSLAASIPAVVSEILVSEGESVVANQKLILLESMKMVIPIQSPYAGLVAHINCQEGDSVQAGVPLIEVTQDTEES